MRPLLEPFVTVEIGHEVTFPPAPPSWTPVTVLVREELLVPVVMTEDGTVGLLLAVILDGPLLIHLIPLLIHLMLSGLFWSTNVLYS